MKRKVIAGFAVLTTLLAGALPGGAAAKLSVDSDVAQAINDAKTAKTYIVVLERDPVAGYDGGVKGLAATKPVAGKKLNAKSANAKKYASFLRSEHSKLMLKAGLSSSKKLYSYTTSLNGFAARMTSKQARLLAKQSGVLLVVPDSIKHPVTDSSPTFLALDYANGPYDNGINGEGVVVGVIDTGIWPEHPSFADDGSYDPPPAGFSGTGCDFGNTAFNPDDDAFTCNNKLLAAKYYGVGFFGSDPEGQLADGSYLSARDEDGHGTHTTSTAAGNAGVEASVLGADYGTINGIAYRAHISVYKACWDTAPGEGGCANSDLVAAIDQAVADGVDVINYSIGGGQGALSPDAFSFLFANDVGVHSSVSASNDGPGAATIAMPAESPWVTAVAASTQKRDFRGTTSLGNSSTYEGVTITPGVGSSSLVDAEDLGNALCDPDVAFSGPVTGKIVLCVRGVVARVAKSQAVSNAGGVGMILYNPSLNTLNTDNHYVPSIHINETDGAAVKAYIASAGSGATASLSGGQKVNGDPNVMAAFSSRGPNTFLPDIIKPDISAPGVNILAGASPTQLLGSPDELFQAISGTSMSAPHVAGVLALLDQAHPDWSPAAVQSALMTSARKNLVKENGVTSADAFDFGAGHIRPGFRFTRRGSPFNPGIVYDAGFFDYVAALCEAPGVVSPDFCVDLEAAGFSLDARDLNLASIGVSDVVGSSVVTRTMSNVTGRTYTWSATTSAPSGFKVKVSPKVITLGPGDSATFTVTITRTSAPFDDWRFGWLTWNAAGYRARSPIAAQALKIAAPDEILGEGTSGSTSFEVGFGYTGAYSANAHGLVAARETADTVVDDPANDINVALTTGIGINIHELSIPAGTALQRFSLFDDFTDGDDDLDLYVFDPDGNFVGGSGSGTSAEEVNLVAPAAGTYFVVVHGWETDGPDADYTLFDWSVPEATGGSLAIDSEPASATSGGSGTVDVSWSGLTAGNRYLGAVSHSSDTVIEDLTVVVVDA